MVPTGSRRCLMAVAAAVALLATQSAFAADQCVLDVASGLADHPAFSPDPDAPDALVIQGDLVPISLAVGASAVAPRTVHAVDDASIQADRTCGGGPDISRQTLAPDDHRHLSEPPVAVDGLLGAALAPVVGREAPRILPRIPATTSPLRGVHRPIERPPRR